MRHILIALFIITFIDFGQLAHAQFRTTVVFVNAATEAEGNGQSWSSPYSNLQDALAFARDHPVDQIWVAAGIYNPTTELDVRTAFELVDGVDLYGGFIGNETHLEQRDPEVNVTTLSGFLDEDNSIRSIHVVVADEATAGLDGFVVTGGCACGTPEGSYNQIEDLRGGGLRASHSQISLSAMTFTANRAGDARGGDFGPMTGSGGAVYFHDGSLSVINSIFDSNTASTSQGGRGGALMSVDGNLEIIDTQFTNNTIGGPPFVGAAGGAVRIENSSTVIRGSLFENNVAGGGFGGAISAVASPIVIIQSDFIDNKANNMGGSGAMSVANNSDMTMINVRMLGNSGEYEIGCMSIATTATVSIVNSIFVKNRLVYDWNTDLGAATILNRGQLEVINSTFAGNQLPGTFQGQGTSIRQIGENAVTTIRNGIYWDVSPSSAPIYSTAGKVSVNRAIIRNGFEGGTDVLDEDPFFVLNPWNNPTGYGDLRLQVGSPAINFGLTEFLPPDTYDLDGDGDTTEPIPIDLAGEPRIQGAEVDLGAYEGPISVSDEPGAVSAPDRLSVYPNPATTIASVSLSLATGRSNVRVEVLDLLGRRVMVLHDGPSPAGTTTLELDARSLPAGLYLVRVIGDDVRLPATMITIVR